MLIQGITTQSYLPDHVSTPTLYELLSLLQDIVIYTMVSTIFQDTVSPTEVSITSPDTVSDTVVSITSLDTVNETVV